MTKCKAVGALKFGCSGRRVVAVANQAVREGMRHCVPLGFGLGILLLVAGVGILRSLHFGTDPVEFVSGLGLAGMSVFGWLCTIVLTVQFFHGEFEARTSRMLFTRPLGRFEFVLGRWLGTVVLMGVFFASAAVALTGQVGLMADADAGGAGWRHWEIVAGGMIAWFKCALLAAAVQCAAAALCGRLLATMAGVTILVICHARPVLDDAARRIGSPILEMIVRGVARAVPDFPSLDIDPLRSGSVMDFLGAISPPMLHGGVYLVGLLIAGGLILRGREA